MDATQFAEELFGAIDDIAISRVNNIKYDKTVKCTIIDNTNASKLHEYTVSDGTTTFIAYSDNTEYKLQASVYVLIPNGDYSQAKTILSSYSETNSTNYYNFTTAFDKMVDMTGDIIKSTSIKDEFGLKANVRIKNDKTIDTSSDNNKITFFSTSENVNSLTDYDVMGISADFKTYLTSKGVYGGEYGLCIIIRGYEKTNVEKEVAKIYTLNSLEDMYGDPYNYMTYYTQQQVFNISNFDTITSITACFYEEDNFVQNDEIYVPPTGTYSDIYMKDPYICFGMLADSYEANTVIIKTIETDGQYESIRESNADLTTFNDKNKKHIKIAWIYEDDDGNLTCVNNTDKLPTNSNIEDDDKVDVKIHWYVYDKTYEETDPIAGKGWREAFVDTNNSLEPTFTISADDSEEECNFFSFPSGSQEYKTFEVDFIPNYQIDNNKIMAVIEYCCEEKARNWIIVNEKTVNDFYNELISSSIDTEFLANFFNSNYNTTAFKSIIDTLVKNDSTTWKSIKTTNASSNDEIATACEAFCNLSKDNLNLFLLSYEDNFITSYNSKGLNYYKSAVLTFSANTTISEKPILDNEINFLIDPDGNNGNYNLYDDIGNIINASDASKLRPIYVIRKPKTATENIQIASTVIWKFPKNGSMIVTPVADKEFISNVYTEIPNSLMETSQLMNGTIEYYISNDDNVKLKNNLLKGIKTYYTKNAIGLGDGYTIATVYSDENTYYEKKYNYTIAYDNIYIKNSEDEYIKVSQGTSYNNLEVYYLLTSGTCNSIDDNDYTILTYHNVPVDENLYIAQNFRISSNYSPMLENNTILFSATINGENITNKKCELSFMGASTNGTNFSFVLVPNEPILQIKESKEDISYIYLTPKVYDYAGKEVEDIDWSKLKLDWYSCAEDGWVNIKNDNGDTLINDAYQNQYLLKCKTIGVVEEDSNRKGNYKITTSYEYEFDEEFTDDTIILKSNTDIEKNVVFGDINRFRFYNYNNDLISRTKEGFLDLYASYKNYVALYDKYYEYYNSLKDTGKDKAEKYEEKRNLYQNALKNIGKYIYIPVKTSINYEKIYFININGIDTEVIQNTSDDGTVYYTVKNNTKSEKYTSAQLKIKISTSELNYDITNGINNYLYYILHADLQGNQIEYIQGQKTNIDTYFPVCVALDSYGIKHYDGCTSIIYDASGSNPVYYKNSYAIYDKNYEQIQGNNNIATSINNKSLIIENNVITSASISKDGITLELALTEGYVSTGGSSSLQIATTDLRWEIKTEEEINNDNDEALGYPTMTTAYTVQPLSMYLQDNGEQVAAVAYMGENNIPIFTCPIRIAQNSYSMALINSWDGKLSIDEETGNILATMVGAGRKNSNNQFEGVLMGQVNQNDLDTAASIGLFGYNEGVQAFGFRSDGTAFIGKSGRGRIEFDGNHGIIESANYLLPNDSMKGMKIDLDDGIIDIAGPLSNGARARITIKPETPYFQIDNAAGITVMKVNDTGATIGGWTIGEDSLSGGKMSLKSNGSIETTYFSVKEDGSIEATSGTIGGWTITANSLYVGSKVVVSEGWAYNGNTRWSINVNGVFGVKPDGSMVAKEANITGTVTANSGKIGGWKINSNSLTGGNMSLNSNGSINTGSFYINTDGGIGMSNGNFYVTSGGYLYCNNVYVKGTISGGTVLGSGATIGGNGSITYSGSDTVINGDSTYIKGTHLDIYSNSSRFYADATTHIIQIFGKIFFSENTEENYISGIHIGYYPDGGGDSHGLYFSTS